MSRAALIVGSVAWGSDTDRQPGTAIEITMSPIGNGEETPAAQVFHATA
jgi:hypothetical protein